MVLDAICLLFGFDETWEESKRNLLGDIKFLDKLVYNLIILFILMLILIWKKLKKANFLNFVTNIYQMRNLKKKTLLNNQRLLVVCFNG